MTDRQKLIEAIGGAINAETREDFDHAADILDTILDTLPTLNVVEVMAKGSGTSHHVPEAKVMMGLRASLNAMVESLR